jgi:membrane associated rhomboid family serine protease
MNDYQRPSGFSLMPEAVKNILIINGLLFLATIVLGNQGIDLPRLLGLHYWGGSDFRFFQFITYQFMHGGFAHIFFNMFAVWMFGTAIEQVWGSRRFLTYYLLTGVGAALCHYGLFYFELRPLQELFATYQQAPTVEHLEALLHSPLLHTYWSGEVESSVRSFVEEFNTQYSADPEKAMIYSVGYVKELENLIMNAPLVVGASGSVFGLLLAYGLLFPNNIIYIYFALPIRAKYFMILYGAIELFSGIANVPGDNVAHFAHLGGLITGFLLIQFWRHRNRRTYRY